MAHGNIDDFYSNFDSNLYWQNCGSGGYYDNKEAVKKAVEEAAKKAVEEVRKKATEESNKFYEEARNAAVAVYSSAHKKAMEISDDTARNKALGVAKAIYYDSLNEAHEDACNIFLNMTNKSQSVRRQRDVV